MPTPAQISLPIPTNEYEFESITRDYCEIVYGHAELHGRRGQSQHGIDIYCKNNDKYIGVQCKCYSNLSITDIDTIIEKANEFPAHLDDLIIATTAQRDSSIQEYVILKDQASEKSIKLLYWDNISNLIKQHPNVLRLHYPNTICIISDDLSAENNSITINSLKDMYNEAVQCFHIIDFVNIDPQYGIPTGLPYDIDIFCYEIDELLKRMILLQEMDIYKEIKHFAQKIKEYNIFLAHIMYPSGNGLYTIQNKSDLNQIDIIIKKDLAFKEEINSIYSKINIGLSLFA